MQRPFKFTQISSGVLMFVKPLIAISHFNTCKIQIIGISSSIRHNNFQTYFFS
jgi:hypothetical protein